MCLSGSLQAENLVLQDVRHWTQNGITRIAVQLSGQAEVRRDRLSKPERYFFDFQQTQPNKKGMQTIAVGDSLVRQIRIAEAKPGVARVVLDLIDQAEVTTSELSNPYRLMIEVKKPGSSAAPPPEHPVVSTSPFTLQAAPVRAVVPQPTQSVAQRPATSRYRPFPPPPTRPFADVSLLLPLAPNLTPYRKAALPAPPIVSFPRQYRGTSLAKTVHASVGIPTAPGPTPAPVARPPQSQQPAQAARRGSTGTNSMTRALGLKIRRVVLDPGHGGHDQGSSGPTGLLEKELVLDVALRLGELISANLGSEIVYTRSDDHFVPLETRTKIANDSKADLFVSIHANSSVIRSVTGVETYYLSFTTSKEALDVAARENATSERSVFELRDLLQKIALQEKVEESRDFATRVNGALYRVWGPAGATRNRGVKKAPFVVLIGASMPSILTEIGFISNPHDEKELRKAETRQKIAEALYKGIAQYADSLSHFAVASRGKED